MFGSARQIEIKTPDQLRRMRSAGLVVAAALQAAATAARPGARTRDLDTAAHAVIRSAGAASSFLGYGTDQGVPGFPAVTCISVNDEIVHGIPGDRVLAEGDLVSIDCGAVVEGWHGDAALSVFAGEPSPDAGALVEGTRMALWHGIAAARLGGFVADISAAVEDCARSGPTQYGIVEEYTGHGIGSAMHQPPDVPNVRRARLGPVGRGPRIVPGLVLAVEPMLTLGQPANHELDDQWTVVTDDGSIACHWEHTMTVTDQGIWVLTAADGGEAMLSALGAPFGPL